MSSFGDEKNDNDLSSTTETLNDTSSMSSDSSALSCPDTLRLIFEKLPIADLAPSSCVCRAWNSVASDQDIVVNAFKSPWRLKRVVGKPASGSFWRDNSFGKFAVSHRISRGDSLAVKYSVQVMDINRLNNMMSEHGIYSRERLLIPISDPEMLVGATCNIEVDPFAKREVAVLYLEGGPDQKAIDSRTLSQKNGESSGANSESSKKRLLESLRRSMQVDDATALY